MIKRIVGLALGVALLAGCDGSVTVYVGPGYDDGEVVVDDDYDGGYCEPGWDGDYVEYGDPYYCDGYYYGDYYYDDYYCNDDYYYGDDGYYYDDYY